MQQHTVLILGSFDPTSRIHRATRDAIHHAAKGGDIVANTRWMGPDDVDLYPGLVEESSAVLLAPPKEAGSQLLSTAFLNALRIVREKRLPFVATGSAHALVFVEIARNLLDMPDAGGACFSADAGEPLIHAIPKGGSNEPETDEMRVLDLMVTDHQLVSDLHAGAREIQERTNVVFGLSPDYARAMEDTGLIPAIIDAQGGRPYLHALEGHPYHLTAAYLPQVRSSPENPHPLFEGLLAAAADE